MGGLYNAVFGYNPGCLLLAPMLTDQNPEEFFPRFRDCFLGDSGETIVIFTRVGGGNRSEDPDDEYSFGEEKLYDMPTFIRTWDDDFDDTYGYYEFGVPDEWKEDFEHVKRQEFDQLSEAYVDRMQTCFKNLNIRAILLRDVDATGEDAEGDNNG